MTASKLTYAEQLKHPNWQRKRLEMLNAADWTCTGCGSKENTLHVHHRQYVKGRQAWEYEATELQVLCELCHEQEHADKKVFEALLVAEWKGFTGEKMALGFLAGFLAPMDLDVSPQANALRHLPFFDIGIAAAALGPVDLAAALRRKMEEGRLPKCPEVENFLDLLAGY